MLIERVIIKCLLCEWTEKAMAPHSSTLAWKIPWAEEPGRLQSMGSLRVGHDWATSLSSFTSMHWRRKWQPTPVFCLENPRDGGTWWAAICGVAQSQTQLKRLSRIQNSMILFCYLSFIAEVWNPSWFLFLCWHLCSVYVCFLHLWSNFCFVHGFICTIIF